MSKDRAATLEDCSGIARVHVDARHSSYVDLPARAALRDVTHEEREIMWRGIIGARDIRYVAFAENASGEVVGFASCGPNRVPDPSYPGELYAIYLLEGRGEGFGLALRRRS